MTSAGEEISIFMIFSMFSLSSSGLCFYYIHLREATLGYLQDNRKGPRTSAVLFTKAFNVV